MKKVPIKFFSTNPYAYWDKLPLTVTKRGKPFAVVSPYGKVNEDLEKIKKVVSKTPRDNQPTLTCKHGYPRDICRKCNK